MKTKDFIRKIYSGEIMEFFILDTETTGLDIYSDEIIQASILHIKNMKIHNEYNSLYYTNLYISNFISNLTGIRKENIAKKKRIANDNNFINFFNDNSIIISHNTGFDKNILLNNGVDLSSKNWINSIYLFKALFPEEKDYKLDTIVNKYGQESPLFEGRHNSLNDVYNLAYSLKKGYEMNPNVDEILSRKLSKNSFEEKSDDYNAEYNINKKKIKSYFKNKIICFTGSLIIKRSAMIELIESIGGIHSKNITNKVDMIIVGENPGSKLEKAKEKNIEIIEEENFRKIVN